MLISWNEISSAPLNGYSDVIGYHIYSNGGSGDTFNLLMNSTLYGVTTAEISSLTAGVEYAFKVQAHNVHGTGTLSASASKVAASSPSQPSHPTLTEDGLNV